MIAKSLALGKAGLIASAVSFLIIASSLGNIPFPAPVFANSLGCGDTIVTSATLGNDLSCTGSGLILGSNGISLDCEGHRITGSWLASGPKIGINITGRIHTTVKNCVVSNYITGYSITSGSGNVIMNDTADSDGVGFKLYSTINNSLTNNTARRGGEGFFLHLASNNTLRRNQAEGTRTAFHLYDRSNSNTLVNNTAMGSVGEGFLLDRSSSNSLRSNIVRNASGSGFELLGDFNILTNNTSTGNLYESGFSVESGHGNSLGSNSASNNPMYGYIDYTEGNGTLGTDNIYATNICSGNGLGGSRPSGLCPGVIAGTISPSASAIDLGQSVTLIANASRGTPPYSYKWYVFSVGLFPADCKSSNSIGAVSSSVSVSPSPSFDLSHSGPGTIVTAYYTYYYQVNDNSTSGQSTACSVGSLIRVHPGLRASATNFSSGVLIGTSVRLTASAAYGTPPYSYQWYPGQACPLGKEIPGAKSNYFSTGTLFSNSTFSVLITDSSKGNPVAGSCALATVSVSGVVGTPSTSMASTTSTKVQSSTGSGEGGIPEFPNQVLATSVITMILMISYVLARQRSSHLKDKT